MGNEIYEELFRLRVSDFDCFDRLTPFAILDLSQDIAGKHAANLHVGYDDLISNDVVWMLLRTRYEFYAHAENCPKKAEKQHYEHNDDISDTNFTHKRETFETARLVNEFHDSCIYGLCTVHNPECTSNDQDKRNDTRLLAESLV